MTTASADPKAIVVRNARTTDLEAVLELAQRGELFETGIAESFAGFLVAEHGGVTIGSCGLEEHAGDGLLRTVVVAPEHRGRGGGRKLVEAAMARARVLELRAVYLLTTTAREFFAELGFEVTTRELAPPGIRSCSEFVTGCPTTALLMRRAT